MYVATSIRRNYGIKIKAPYAHVARCRTRPRNNQPALAITMKNDGPSSMSMKLPSGPLARESSAKIE